MFRSLEPVCELMSIPDTCPEEEGCKDEPRLDPSITLHSGEENETKLLALILVCFPISTLTIFLQWSSGLTPNWRRQSRWNVTHLIQHQCIYRAGHVWGCGLLDLRQQQATRPLADKDLTRNSVPTQFRYFHPEHTNFSHRPIIVESMKIYFSQYLAMVRLLHKCPLIWLLHNSMN